MSDLLLPRIGSRRHRGVPTLGPVVGEVASRLGLTFYDWQTWRADVSYELEPCPIGCRLAAGTLLTIAGRQTGKTTAVTADVAFRALAPDLPQVAELVGHPVGPQQIAFTAQDRKSALGRWYDHVDRIMDSDLASYVSKVVRKNGEEHVEFCNGSKYWVVTPSRTGARGMALDVVIIDEALAHEPWLLDVIAPTMAQRDGASVSFGAQLIIVSNAGDESAELLNQQREMGRRAVADDDRGRVHIEYSCPDDADPLDPAVWAQTIPTLDRRDGLSMSLLARQAETMGTDAFAREYLCKTMYSQTRRVIAVDDWAELPHVQIPFDDVGAVAVEVDVDRASSVIVAAAAVDGQVGVRIVDQRPGVDWVVDAVAALVPALVVVDRAGPASSLIPALEQVATVLRASSNDVADAAAGLVDAVAARRVGHTGDVRFQDAVTWLARRQRGDRWVFDRSHGDVASIVAASLAVWAIETVPSEASAVF